MDRCCKFFLRMLDLLFRLVFQWNLNFIIRNEMVIWNANNFIFDDKNTILLKNVFKKLIYFVDSCALFWELVWGMVNRIVIVTY